MSAFLALIRRDVSLAFRESGALGAALGFYLMVIATVPLGLGPDLALLSRIAPGLIWVALLLSALLSADRLFQADFEDGTLDALALGPMPLELTAAAKALAHWIATALPLVALAPLLGLMLNLEAAAYPPLLISMLLGTPAVSFVASVGAALTLGLRRGGLLLSLLVLPLYAPVMIFGSGAVNAALTSPAGATSPFLVLAAMSLAAMALAPFAAAAALRAQLS